MDAICSKYINEGAWYDHVEDCKKHAPDGEIIGCPCDFCYATGLGLCPDGA